MSDIDKTGINTGDMVTLEELAEKFASTSNPWALFLGTGVSVENGWERRQALSELARQACKTAPDLPVSQKIRQAVQNHDFMELSGALFGDIWDGSSFLDEDRERNIMLRNAYRERLRGKDEINVHKVNKHPWLRELIGKFPGIILTICQDDTVEAFWEYENSLPADTIVYTPQLIADSNHWSRWLCATEDEVAYLKSQSESSVDATVLVKLFGTRDEPTKMLLSKHDVGHFYPPDVGRADKNRGNTIRFLEKIFDSYNVLFVGADLENDWLLGSAEGILKILEREPRGGAARYALLCGEIDSKYHIQKVGGWNDSSAVRLLELIHNLQPVGGDSQETQIDENALLEGLEENLGLFWLFYNRRPQKFFLPKVKSDGQDCEYNAHTMEYNVLKRDIFGFRDHGETVRKWNRKKIRQLAVAANNFSDFYDLRDAMELARTEEGEPYETTLKTLLSSRFSEKSLLLYRILQRYESGFPIGFLQLLPTEKIGLKSWKRAAIQLANSGVYVQRHGKHRLYERLSYADCVMQTAGSSPFQARICNEIFDIRCRTMYSYFYPFHKVEIEESNKIQNQEIDKHFTYMFRTLYEILRDKSEGYHQIHSLLQTELPTIVYMMQDPRLDEELKWMPGLLYYLLRESRVSVEGGRLLACCASLEKKCKELQSCGNKGLRRQEPRWRLFCVELMLHQAKALIMSQSVKIEEQQASANECKIVDDAVFDAQKEQKLWKGETPFRIFEHRIHACFLRGMLFGRMSTIREIERCKAETPECAEQMSLLEEMKKSLDYAEKLIEGRERSLGEQYKELRGELARLRGEYHFKMSQYYGENRRFVKKCNRWSVEEKHYQKSEEAYIYALKYYNRNPDQYWVQRADTMRNIADMYCQWARSIGDMPKKSQRIDQDKQERMQKCYENLINAYILYRVHSDLHGIADVLQSMGQAESYTSESSDDSRHRTRLCYYKASVDLYQHLGDAWSRYVAFSFLEECSPSPTS